MASNGRSYNESMEVQESCLVRFLILQGIEQQFHPILGKFASIKLKLIKLLDNDKINNTSILSMKPSEITTEYKEVFQDTIGRLEEYQVIKIKDGAIAKKHAQRTIAVPLREGVKKEIARMEEEGIIKKVTEPTLWVSSMVVVKKKTGQLRICLDPRDLNENIIRENYPLPTIESIATRLSEAKVFSVLDVRHGFWHMVLDEESSFLTTFNTPFGRYRWLRMPFGICSAPEIFQRKMYEKIESMEGIEVVADDFLIYGCSKTTELANEDHDRKFGAFLEKC